MTVYDRVFENRAHVYFSLAPSEGSLFKQHDDSWSERTEPWPSVSLPAASLKVGFVVVAQTTLSVFAAGGFSTCY